MAEPGLKTENPSQIPEHWQFEEKPLEVIQIDPDQGYLAFKAEHPYLPKDSTIEYFFNSSGIPVSGKGRSEYGKNLILERGEVANIQYTYGHNDWSKRGEDILVVQFFEVNPRGDSGISPFGQGTWRNSLAFSEDGDLMRLNLEGESNKEPTTFFDKNEDGKFHIAPKQIASPENPLFYSFIEDGQNRAIYTGNKDFVVEWDTIEEKDFDGNTIPVFIVTQTHLTDGKKKIMRAPLQIDIKKVRAAMLSRPLYGKDEGGKLDVPWKDIDRLVGARLSYSNEAPPDIQKQLGKR